MPLSTSDGQYFEDSSEYYYNKIFGKQEEQQPQGEGKLFLVRHGDTALNDADVIHGWVNTPLNDKGIEDAHKAADSLDGKNITRIVSSDLPRAKQTANIISKKLGIPVTLDPNLRTWDSGDFDGTDKHEEFKKYINNSPDKTPPGSSESFNQFANRAITSIAILEESNHNTAAITHSKPLKAFNAWEHSGYPEDTRDISIKAYHDLPEQKPGKHEEIKIVMNPDERVKAMLGAGKGLQQGGSVQRGMPNATYKESTTTESAESIKPTGNAERILNKALGKQRGEDMESIKDLYLPKLEKSKDLE